MLEYKFRIKRSIEKFSARQLKTTTVKNSSPEKLVEKDCMKWFEENGFDITIIDSSSYNHWGQARVSEFGFSDAAGNYGSLAVYVEFKARGRRKNLSYKQYKFLERKIAAGCFAVVVDRVELLNEIFNKWRLMHINESKTYLMTCLPMSDEVKKTEAEINQPLFFDDE